MLSDARNIMLGIMLVVAYGLPDQGCEEGETMYFMNC